MQPRRKWQAGDEYWSLWISAEDGHRFTVCEGVVTAADECLVQLAGGSWRYVQEGTPFASREEAVAYIARLSSGDTQPPESGVRDISKGVDNTRGRGAEGVCISRRPRTAKQN